MSKQTKLSSLLESCLNVGSGLVLSYFIWILVLEPIWSFELKTHEIFSINIIFTIASVGRGYLWRRYFNRKVV